jgi:SRSO17 transposase
MVKARDAKKTVKFIDEYCEVYRDLFPEVRSYECFKSGGATRTGEKLT